MIEMDNYVTLYNILRVTNTQHLYIVQQFYAYSYVYSRENRDIVFYKKKWNLFFYIFGWKV